MKGEYETIREAGAQVVAVSTDDLAAHERFCQELGGCPFPLVSDPELVAARLYGVLGKTAGGATGLSLSSTGAASFYTRFPGSSRATSASFWRYLRSWALSKRERGTGRPGCR